jgi:cytochrome oxidase Cu insertion factor (SCO1/SenC/PrrC family)
MALRVKTAALSLATLLCAATLVSAQAGSKAAAKAAEKPALKLKVGDLAPDFTMKTMTADGLKDVSLHDFKGKKNVVVAFYVFAFTGG